VDGLVARYWSVDHCGSLAGRGESLSTNCHDDAAACDLHSVFSDSFTCANQQVTDQHRGNQRQQAICQQTGELDTCTAGHFILRRDQSLKL